MSLVSAAAAARIRRQAGFGFSRAAVESKIELGTLIALDYHVTQSTESQQTVSTANQGGWINKMLVGRSACWDFEIA